MNNDLDEIRRRDDRYPPLNVVRSACFLVFLGGMVACSGRPAAAPAGRGLEGVWKTDGYGNVLMSSGDTLHAFEVTETTCVRAGSAIRQTGDPAGGTRYLAGGEVWSFTPGVDASEMHLQGEGAASYQVIRRLPALPAVCSPPTPDTPEGNFEVFARTWAEHYILFDQKKADWAAMVAATRTELTPTTPPERLFELMRGMIAPFEDAHTMIVADSIGQRYHGLRKGTDRIIKSGFADFTTKDLPAILAVTDGKLAGPLRKWCNDQVQYGHVDDSTGYLRILSESGYTKDGGFATGMEALEAALDTVFSDPALKGLIIDVRINFGGADPYGLALASRLTTTEYQAYSKEARLDPADRSRWTPGQPSIVRPTQRPSFAGPVVELIGPLTISAGETTTQALMGRSPRIIRIGEHTQGVFSDVLGRRLPNGWFFGLPNEVFRTADGKTFDGPGIPPDIAVPVFSELDLAAKNDSALSQARAELYLRR